MKKKSKSSARASYFLIQFNRRPLHDYRVKLPNI